MRRALVALFAAALLMAGCAPGDGPSPSPTSATPTHSGPKADAQVTELVTALNAKDLSKLRTVQGGTTAQTELTLIFAGMDDVYPKFTAGPIDYQGEVATTKLTVSYPDLGSGWTYQSTARFRLSGDTWVFDWAPSVIQPELTEKSRLRHLQKEAKRGSINDSAGLALVEERARYEVGLDKSRIPAAEWAAAAKKIAGLLRIDPEAYATKVAAAGPKAFVVATAVRQEQIPASITDVKGSHVNEVSAILGPTDTFASALLGVVGQPTAKMIKDSKGKLSTADRVGLSGLQLRYDTQLRGVPSRVIQLVARKGVKDVPTKVLFQQDASIGKPIDLALNRDLQAKAETVLGAQTGVASLVVIDVKTGGLLAAAQSPAAGSYPYVSFGKYAPGSTFKAVTALGMLRSGATASSRVQCPSKLKVDTYTFGNYSGYPSSGLGSVSLTEAFKYSCNTAFVGASQVTGDLLHSAAASLGVGTDYDAGFTAYFGTVAPTNAIDAAASRIGQGQVTMSPLGMAAVAASIASGKTTIPWLVKGHQATSKAAPLTAAEAEQLQAMMKATVDSGTGRPLKGVMTGAKSGTAQWGKVGELQTHAWMIAYNGNYAVSAFVEVGDSGGTTAAPLIVKLFS